jgi:hypothetical protein
MRGDAHRRRIGGELVGWIAIPHVTLLPSAAQSCAPELAPRAVAATANVIALASARRDPMRTRA